MVPHLEALPRVTELGIRSEDGLGVARQVDFWNDRDVSLRGVVTNVSKIVGRVEAAVGHAVLHVVVLMAHR